MSDQVTEFANLLGQKNKQSMPIQTAYAICKSVDWEKKTMTATGQTDELDYHDVKLGNGFEYKRPKNGALCLIGLVENQGANAFLIDASEVLEYYVKTNTSEVQIKENGIAIKRGNETLKSILNDFMDEVNKIIVINGTTINVAAVMAIKQRLNSVLIE